jgi:hypothetical protein
MQTKFKKRPSIGRTRILSDGTEEKMSDDNLCQIMQKVLDLRGYMVIAVDTDEVMVGDVLTPNVENVTVKVIAKTDLEDLKAEKAMMGERFRRRPMPDEQIGFFFDAPLVEMPASQLPPRPVLPTIPEDLRSLGHTDLVVLLFGISEAIEQDDISYTTVLDMAGFPTHAQTAWHRSRMLEAILPPNGNWQAYRVDPQNKSSELRFRRLPPLSQCPGYDGVVCDTPTLGGVLCNKCKAREHADLAKGDPQPVIVADEPDIPPFAPIEERLR